MGSSFSDKEMRERRGQIGSVVFDRGHTASMNPETRNGISGGYHHAVFGTFRITDKDRQAPKVNVTHILCGDPPPGRPMPQEELTVAPGRVCTESGPVLLTFRELEAAKKLQREGVSL